MAFQSGGNLNNNGRPTRNRTTINKVAETKANEISGLGEEKVNSNRLISDLNSGQKNFMNSDNLNSYTQIEEAQPLSSKDGKLITPKFGVKSLFNPYAIYVNSIGSSTNSLSDYYDSSNAEKLRFAREVNMTKLLDLKNQNKSTPYYISDFLYAKYYEKIPLNRLITLRRYPFATFDNLEFAFRTGDEKFPPIAQAITYLGEEQGNLLKEILKIKGVINWEKLEADVWNVEGNEAERSDSPFLGGGIGKVASILAGNQNNDLSGRRANEVEAYRNFGDKDYTNHILGPVNVIKETYVRGRGIGSELSFSLVFEYELKSYKGINPKMAMLDLIANLFSLVYNNAKFWGGANRYFPNSPQYGFPGGKEGQNAYYNGDYGNFLGILGNEMGTAFSNIGNFLSNLMSGLMNGDFSSLTNFGKKAGSTYLDIKSHKTRPKAIGFHSLLSGMPHGEWHVCIGNPLNPIAMIGNLIVEDFELELGESLGLDDFPDSLKFTVNLKSGRPRDKSDLESIFNNGNGKIYYNPKGTVDILNSSASTANNMDKTSTSRKTINQ
jgi:hypothetical protein